MIVVRIIQTHDSRYHMLTYQGENVPFVQSFKYLGIDVLATYKWNVCFEFSLKVGWKSYYKLENH